MSRLRALAPWPGCRPTVPGAGSLSPPPAPRAPGIPRPPPRTPAGGDHPGEHRHSRPRAPPGSRAHGDPGAPGDGRGDPGGPGMPGAPDGDRDGSDGSPDAGDGPGGPGGDRDNADGDLDDGFDDRSVRLDTTLGGAGVLYGDLTPDCAALVATVLDALSGRAGAEDTRGKAQRWHDALAEALR
jgi:hypothetical protein